MVPECVTSGQNLYISQVNLERQLMQYIVNFPLARIKAKIFLKVEELKDPIHQKILSLILQPEFPVYSETLLKFPAVKGDMDLFTAVSDLTYSLKCDYQYSVDELNQLIKEFKLRLLKLKRLENLNLIAQAHYDGNMESILALKLENDKLEKLRRKYESGIDFDPESDEI